MVTETNEKPKKSAHEDIIETAKKRFNLAVEAERDMRELADEDLRFRAGDHWDAEIKAKRALEKRPCLTVNRIPQFIRQVTNDQRQNRPAIRVSPVDDMADIETANIYQGLIRHIEYNSNADVAYDTSFEAAVTHGRGFFRIATDYVGPTSFDQELLIKPIENSQSVFFDPHSQEPDGSDANWAIIEYILAKDDYRAQYKGSELEKMPDWETLGNRAPDWIDKDSCRVIEYFYKEFEDDKLFLLQSPVGEVQPVLKSEYQKNFEQYAFAGWQIIEGRERDTKIPVVKWCKINGVEVLEETVFAGPWIPVIPVYGDKIILDGKKIYEGIVRHAKDPQKMLNYWVTAETETIALAPKAPWIAAEGQLDEHPEWETANTEAHAYLEYTPVSHEGMLAPAPQRQVFEAPTQAITQARHLASEDLKATTGIYDASLGARSNENSGIAIQRRNMQAQTSNFHFVDNLTRSIKHAGRILIAAIPHVYDTPRTARIIGQEGEDQIVRLNEEFRYKGEMRTFNMGVGKYDVTVDVGPSFATKRQEAAESMLSFLQAFPQAAPIIGDLLAKNMDWPGSHEIAERLKKMVPPEMLDREDGEAPPIPPEVQQQLQQYGQLIDELTQKLNEANDEIRTKTMDIESKERIAFSEMQTKLEIEKLKVQASAEALAFKEEMASMARLQAAIADRLGLVDIHTPVDEPDMGAQVPAQMPDSYNQQPTGGFSPGPSMEF